MNTGGIPRALLIGFLSLVFTAGLTFITLEAPYRIDRAMQGSIPTPGFDSFAGEFDVLKTELFISHYRLREIGYAFFGAMVLLIAAGFVTRKTGLASLGAVAFMLPLFAQFASVMFFLSGLGLLNVAWLPLLDISLGVQELGLIIRAPYQLFMWLFGLVGVNAYMPLVVFFTGGGLLLFFLGTWTWLSARSSGAGVAGSRLYRFSRHPQYLGWIMWSYGVYLLLLRGRYPKRSWGIDGSLPWLIATMVIIGVALMEELGMRRRHGEEYEIYASKTPFMFPLPRFARRLFALPQRVLFGRWRLERRFEVAAVVALYAAILMVASVMLYGNGITDAKAVLASEERRAAEAGALSVRILEEEDWRVRHRIAGRLARYDEAAVPHFMEMLASDRPEIRELAAGELIGLRASEAAPALTGALDDVNPNVRWKAAEALGALGDTTCAADLMPLLDDEEGFVRNSAMRILAAMGEESITGRAIELCRSPDRWTRVAAIQALGALRSKEGLPALIEALGDEEADVRRSAAVALLLAGSPAALPALDEAAGDEDREVRIYAEEAAKRIRKTTSETPEA